MQHAHFGVYAVIGGGDRLLLVRKTAGPYTGLYDLPGGRPEFGEDLLQALIRELAEELGLTVMPRHLQLAHAFAFVHDHSAGQLHHQAVVYRYIGPPVVVHGAPVSEDTAGAVWADVTDGRLSPLARETTRRDRLEIARAVYKPITLDRRNS